MELPTVPKTVQEIITAVRDLIEAHHMEPSLGAVAIWLRLDRSTVSRRVKAAIVAGYIKNLDRRLGVAARLVLGEPLPAETSILPEPEELRDRCTVAPPTVMKRELLRSASRLPS